MDDICFRWWDSGTGEGMGLRPLAVLKDSSLIPSTHICNSSCGGGRGDSTPSFGLCGHCMHSMHWLTSRENTHIHKVKDKQKQRNRKYWRSTATAAVLKFPGRGSSFLLDLWKKSKSVLSVSWRCSIPLARVSLTMSISHAWTQRQGRRKIMKGLERGSRKLTVFLDCHNH